VRILYDPGPYGHMKTWCGEEGGYQLVILQTGGYLRFYLSVKSLGVRMRLFGRKPFVWIGRSG
jgi:hypothetical protein